MLLSFSAKTYDKLVSGEKNYEHRKVFPNEPIEAYLYVSNPIKSIVGIMHLSNRIELGKWKEIYSYDDNAVKRINNYLIHNKYAMEINDFQNTNRIPLCTLRDELPHFIVPQMYYYIDDTFLLDYLQTRLHPVGKRITHDFTKITSDQICR